MGSGQNNFVGVGLGAVPLTATIGADAQQDALVLVSTSVTPSGGDGSYTYAWELLGPDGSDQSALLSSTTAQSPTWTPTEAGGYTERVTVSDGSGQSTYAARQVVVGDDGWILRWDCDCTAVGVLDLLTGPKTVTDVYGNTLTAEQGAGGTLNVCAFGPTGLLRQKTGAGSGSVLMWFNTLTGGWTPAEDEDLCFQESSTAVSFASDWSWDVVGFSPTAAGWLGMYGNQRRAPMPPYYCTVGRVRAGAWNDYGAVRAGATGWSLRQQIVLHAKASVFRSAFIEATGALPAPASALWNPWPARPQQTIQDQDLSGAAWATSMVGASFFYVGLSAGGAGLSSGLINRMRIWSRPGI